jgi:hypothetical protein
MLATIQIVIFRLPVSSLKTKIKTYKTKVREGHRLRMFENRVLERTTFGPKREEVEGGWRRRLDKGEHHNLYASPPNMITVIKSRRMKWVEHTARLGEIRNNYSITGVLKHFTTCYIFTVRGC